jgi:hypothetical protein
MLPTGTPRQQFHDECKTTMHGHPARERARGEGAFPSSFNSLNTFLCPKPQVACFACVVTRQVVRIITLDAAITVPVTLISYRYENLWILNMGRFRL